ncbi:Copine-9 [Collichthys lucidus]|uniref:Copine-9 n=1 Tax=Collichthys lucidus TaxID=240159 RepID=A0A4U5UPW5_COLLU|nr:Copine-9 [Collichthys lucidus]
MICQGADIRRNKIFSVYFRTVKVDVYDWDRDGSHDFIGEFTTSYRELSRGQNQFNVYEPTSLHYMSPYQMNAYAMALKAVGEIIQDYDSDKLFPAYGFGAKMPPDGKISHAFPLSGDNDSPNCVGIEGVLEAYFQSLRTVQLYGPTNFAPVINKVAK